jgi:hypothetical protein
MGAAQLIDCEIVGIMKMHVVENVPIHALVELHDVCARYSSNIVRTYKV